MQGCCSFFGAKNEPRNIHPIQGLPLYGKDAIASGGKPPSGKVLVWLAKPVPYGRAMVFDIPAIAAPWKGAHLRRKDSINGTQKTMSFLRLFCAVADKKHIACPAIPKRKKIVGLCDFLC